MRQARKNAVGRYQVLVPEQLALDIVKAIMSREWVLEVRGTYCVRRGYIVGQTAVRRCACASESASERVMLRWQGVRGSRMEPCPVRDTERETW